MAQLRVTSKSLPEHNRQRNRALILQKLFHDGPMSRADLARESGLTKVTVSDLVSELAHESLIDELGARADARVGKPARLIGLNEDAYHTIGLDLSADDRFVGAVIGLGGRIVHRSEVPLNGATGEDAVRIALDLAHDLERRSTVRVLGIGISTPGVVDNAGVVLAAPNLEWTTLDLAERFRAEFTAPVHVGNDADAAALAVHTFHDPSPSFMLVVLHRGVGAGLVIGNTLVTGATTSAGEIGHVVVDEHGDRCSCGRNGCLELTAAVPRLRARLEGADGADEMSRAAVLAEAGRMLGVAIAPLIAALGLSEVVISGPSDLFEGDFLDAAADTVRARTLAAVTNDLRLSLSDDDDLMLRGAAVLVLTAELGLA
jgi:predicted NBD/HSP70 family sugar kinase